MVGAPRHRPGAAPGRGGNPFPPHPRLPRAFRTARKDEGERPRCLRASRGCGGGHLAAVRASARPAARTLVRSQNGEPETRPLPARGKGQGKVNGKLGPVPPGKDGDRPTSPLPGRGRAGGGGNQAAAPERRQGRRDGGMAAGAGNRSEIEICQNRCFVGCFSETLLPAAFFFPSSHASPGSGAARGRPGAG